MNQFNVLTRRTFLDRSFKIGMGIALSTLTDIPLVMKRALAEGNVGLNGKKLLFIFLRGANDALNSVIPIQDSAYNGDLNPATGTVYRPNIFIPKDGAVDYSATGPCDFPSNALYGYNYAIRLGNGFAALHPSLKYLAPVYNSGDLALIHRVGYPKQSRSHFDSQNYWENGNPNKNVVKDGIFYRTILESGLASTQALTAVSIQSSLPLLLRGSQAALTNLTDPTRYNLFGIPNTTAGNAKADSTLLAANQYPFVDKKNRELLSLQYKNLSDTLSLFSGINFSDAGNTYVDDAPASGGTGYYLFPNTTAKNSGQIDSGGQSFFTNLKAAALILNQTEAIIAGSEITGFDTHNSQGGITGTHANLQRRIGWAIYALQKYFKKYGKGGTSPMPGAKVGWNDLVVVTLSEFGRTSIQNNSLGTDHAEAGVMFVAGGGVKGYNKGNPSGVFGGSPAEFSGSRSNLNWIPGPANQGGGVDGSMFGVSDKYLKRIVDYRSVLGKLIRDHLGATQSQLDRIIPGYAVSGEKLLAGGTSSIDGTPILGEPNLI